MIKWNPCLWFDHHAEEAALFYTSLFKNARHLMTTRYGKAAAQASGQKEGSPFVVYYELEHLPMMALNGGPFFKFTPAFSLFVSCETEDEIEHLWHELSQDGQVRMALNPYPWAPRYGWTADRYGVEWQMSLGPRQQKITPAMLFVKNLFGRGQEAVRFYTSVFPDSKVETLTLEENTQTIAHCTLRLHGQDLILMEGQGEHDFAFNESFSLTVNCKTQEEIDHYWNLLSKGGSTGQCGWLKDKFGVSWQIVPESMPAIMKDPELAEAAMREIVKMTKIEISRLPSHSE